MAFLRYKTIKGKRYHYIVESYWVNGSCKQRVLAYLGTADSLLERLNEVKSDEIFNERKGAHRRNKKGNRIHS